jgi:mannosyltransferase
MLKRFTTGLVRLWARPFGQYVALAAIVLLATALRFYKLGAWSFWIDEIFTTNATPYLSDWPIARLRITLILVRSSLDLFGLSEWSARLAPALVGIVTIPILYFPIRRLFDAGVALIAVLLLALSPWHLYWSQNARFYNLLLLFSSLGLFLIFSGIEKNRPWHFLGGFILQILAVRERIIALFFVPVLACYLLLAAVQTGERIRMRPRYLALILGSLAAFFVYDATTTLSGGHASIMTFFQVFLGQSNHGPLRLLLAIIYQLDLPLVCLGLAGGIWAIARRSRPGLFALCAAFVPPILLVMMAPFVFTIDRYIFFTLPFWTVLTAIAIKELFIQTADSGPILALGVLGLVLVSMLSRNMLYYQFQNGMRPDWRGAYAIVQQRLEEDDLVFATRPEVGEHYLQRQVGHVAEADTQSIRCGEPRAWFLTEEATSRIDAELGRWMEEHSTLVDVLEVSIPGKSLSIRVHLYDARRDPGCP